MNVHYSSNAPLSDEAKKLVEFDTDSIRQVIAADRAGEPDLWLADPEGYQANGHLLRDSESIRLIAYSRGGSVVYATDGCNSCRHLLEEPLDSGGNGRLSTISERVQLPTVLLDRLAELLRQ